MPSSSPLAGQKRVRIRSAETRRWRTYDVDEMLDAAVLQRLNDVAFRHGVEVISTCAGHERRYGRPEVDPEYLCADVRFGLFYPTAHRLAGRQAQICVDAIGRAIAGEATSTEISHDHAIQMWPGRNGKFGRSLLVARHARPTHEDPGAARSWWREILYRLERGPQ